MPQKIHDDQGSEFENDIFLSPEQLTGIPRSRTAPYHPIGNVQCGRFDQTLLGMLRTMAENQKANWKNHINKMTFAYNRTKNESTGFSPFELLFGRAPRLPIDIIFGNTTACTSKRYPQYFKEWKAAMMETHKIEATKAGHCASQNRESYNRRARSSALKPGDRVLVKNVLERGGPGKLRSFWEDKVYIVDSRKGLDSSVYEVHPESDPNRKGVLHRNLLLPCPFLPYEATPVTTKPSVVVKREQSTKEVKCADRFALPASEFIVPDDYEDDLPTFLPSQLDQVCQQFMQSEVNMADQVAPLAPVENKEPSVSSSPQSVCEENQDSTGVPMTDGNPESQEILQIPDSVATDEDASPTLESPPQRPQCS